MKFDSPARKTAGGGVGFALAHLIMFMFPEVNGQAWTSEAALSLGGVLTWLGTLVSPWLPNPPRAAAVALLTLSLGCFGRGSYLDATSKLECGTADTSDVTATGPEGFALYAEKPDGSLTQMLGGKACTSYTRGSPVENILADTLDAALQALLAERGAQPTREAPEPVPAPPSPPEAPLTGLEGWEPPLGLPAGVQGL